MGTLLVKFLGMNSSQSPDVSLSSRFPPLNLWKNHAFAGENLLRLGKSLIDQQNLSVACLLGLAWSRDG